MRVDDEEMREIRELRDKLDKSEEFQKRILTILAGDPTIVDPNNPDSYERSVIGTQQAAARHREELAEQIISCYEGIDKRFDVLEDTRKQDLAQWNLKLDYEVATLRREHEEDLERMDKDKFGWENTVIPFIKKYKGRIAIVLAAGMYVLWKEGLLSL